MTELEKLEIRRLELQGQIRKLRAECRKGIGRRDEIYRYSTMLRDCDKIIHDEQRRLSETKPVKCQ